MYSVTRIRYIAHECLRDQVGSLTITVNSENELGKSVRGKERVRRKGMGKRKRRDDPEEYNVAGEDAQSQLCDTTMELDAVEVDHSRLCPVRDEIEHSLICLPPADGDGAQPCGPASTVHDSQLCHVANNVDDSHFRHAAKRVDHNQPSLAPNECGSQPSHAPTEVVPQSSLETSNEVARKNDYGVLV